LFSLFVLFLSSLIFKKIFSVDRGLIMPSYYPRLGRPFVSCRDNCQTFDLLCSERRVEMFWHLSKVSSIGKFVARLQVQNA